MSRKFYPKPEEVTEIYERMDKIARGKGYDGLNGFIKAETPKGMVTNKMKSDWKLEKSFNYGFAIYFGGHPKINTCLTWIMLGKKHPKD